MNARQTSAQKQLSQKYDCPGIHPGSPEEVIPRARRESPFYRQEKALLFQITLQLPPHKPDFYDHLLLLLAGLEKNISPSLVLFMVTQSVPTTLSQSHNFSKIHLTNGQKITNIFY